MQKVVLIDDEPAAIRTLQAILTEYCSGLEIVGTAQNVLEGIKVIHHTKPHLVFLDIQMPHATGFELLEAFPKREFEVVFLTAHEEFALKALHQQAFDYLLKPADIDEVKAVVEKFQERFAQRLDTSVSDDKLVIGNSDGFVFIKKEDIIMVQGDGSYCHFYLENQKITASKNLKHYVEQLNPQLFFRSHQSYLINLNKVQGYNREGFVIMCNDLKASLSRSKKEAFLATVRM